jgi:hypothetical protein
MRQVGRVSRAIGAAALFGLVGCEGATPEESAALETTTAALSATSWTRYDNRTYALFTDLRTWSSANALCESRGGHLATVASATENEVVRSLIANGGQWHAWLGLSDADNEGTWRWATNEPIPYTNWNPGEPSGGGGTEDWVEMYDSGRWNDNSSTATAPYVCEFGSHGFHLIGTNATWSSAASNCEGRGGYLATISDATENERVRSLIANAGQWHTWLGLNDAANEGFWGWTSQESMSYTNWNSGEPNNGGGVEDWAEMYNTGSWNDASSTATAPYVCEFGRPLFSSVVELPIRQANGDDLLVTGNCLPYHATVNNCQPCPATTVSRTLTVDQQNASTSAQWLVIEKGTGHRDPESRTSYNILSMQFMERYGGEFTVTKEFGSTNSNPDVTYRPNGDVLVWIGTVMGGGRKVKSVTYVEGYSLGIACNMGPAFTNTRMYSRMYLASQ